MISSPESARIGSTVLRLALLFMVLTAVSGAAGQRIAILTPDSNRNAELLAVQLTDKFGPPLKVLDSSLTAAALKSLSIADVFNMTVEDSKRVGEVTGCDFFILINTVTQRRSSVERSTYYETFAPVYLVSSRTGRLIFWGLVSSEADDPQTAEKELSTFADPVFRNLIKGIQSASKTEMAEPAVRKLPTIPDEGSQEAKGFREPVPYLRIKPEYTRLAYLHDVAGTVDMDVELDEKGNVLRTEIVRWLGFGLDDAVDTAVRKMEWRPAERNGKAFPVRFLVRYNFKKIEDR